MSDRDQESVIISVRRDRRGYVVQAVGSDEKFRCSNELAIGEAVLDILDDPSTPRAEFEGAPSSRANGRSSSRSGLAKRDAFRPEPEDEDVGREVMIGGRRTNTKDLQEAFVGEMDLADQIAYQAVSSAWGGLQRMSNWRGNKKKKKKKKG
jgi:hypothetical protein